MFDILKSKTSFILTMFDILKSRTSFILTMFDILKSRTRQKLDLTYVRCIDNN
jgi:hypothetical protein